MKGEGQNEKTKTQKTCSSFSELYYDGFLLDG